MSDKLAFGTFGRYTEIPVAQMTPEQRESDMSLKFTAGRPHHSPPHRGGDHLPAGA